MNSRKVSRKSSYKHAYRVKRPGPKRPKVLPKIGNEMHLSDYGYSLQKAVKQRRSSLKKASKKEGTLAVLRRINLIRNYSKSVPDNYKKLSNDVEYMKKEYASVKRSTNKK
jgi:hypothetical protein